MSKKYTKKQLSDMATEFMREYNLMDIRADYTISGLMAHYPHMSPAMVIQKIQSLIIEDTI